MLQYMQVYKIILCILFNQLPYTYATAPSILNLQSDP